MSYDGDYVGTLLPGNEKFVFPDVFETHLRLLDSKAAGVWKK